MRVRSYRTVLLHELKAFTSADKATLAVQAVLLISWAMVMSSALQDGMDGAFMTWWLFFPVLAGGALSTSTLTAERVSGALEILLTCGLSRGSLLGGKLMFIFLASAVIGTMAAALGGAVATASGADVHVGNPTGVFVLFLGSAFLNAGTSALCSFVLDNPRIAHLANLLLMAAAISAVIAASELFHVPLWSLAGLLFVCGVIAIHLSYRVFRSERIVRPYAP